MGSGQTKPSPTQPFGRTGVCQACICVNRTAIRQAVCRFASSEFEYFTGAGSFPDFLHRTHLPVTAPLLARSRSWSCGVSGRGLSLAGEPGPDPSDISQGAQGPRRAVGGACGKVCWGLVGGEAAGLGGAWAGPGSGDVTGRRGAARSRVGKRGQRPRSLKAASPAQQLLARVRAALPIMSLRSSLSRLLRAQVHSVPRKSVHSVAVIGAPFSQGQVRTGTWHLGAGFPPPQNLEKPGLVGTTGRRGEDGEKPRGDVVADSRDWALGEHRDFPR